MNMDGAPLTPEFRKRAARELRADARVYRRQAAASRTTLGPGCEIFGVEHPQRKADRLEHQAETMERVASELLRGD